MNANEVFNPLPLLLSALLLILTPADSAKKYMMKAAGESGAQKSNHVVRAKPNRSGIGIRLTAWTRHDSHATDDLSRYSADLRFRSDSTDSRVLISINTFPLDCVKVRLFDLMGNKIIEQQADPKDGRLDFAIEMEGEPNGIYFLELTLSAGQKITRRFVKELSSLRLDSRCRSVRSVSNSVHSLV